MSQFRKLCLTQLDKAQKLCLASIDDTRKLCLKLYVAVVGEDIFDDTFDDIFN